MSLRATSSTPCTLEGHTGLISSMAFAPDGLTLASASAHQGAIRLWDLLGRKELSRLPGHDGATTCLAFAPRGTTLASGGFDTSVLLWDLCDHLVPAPPRVAEGDLEKLWKAMQSGDPVEGQKAAWSLAGAGAAAVVFLRDRLQAQAAPSARALKNLVAGLSAPRAADRARARAELARLGEAALPALRKALGADPPLDLRRQLEALIEGVRPWASDAEGVRQLRALGVLQRIGSAEAVGLLETLAGGDPASRFTREARAARDHLRAGRP